MTGTVSWWVPAVGVLMVSMGVGAALGIAVGLWRNRRPRTGPRSWTDNTGE